jgi:hypothetical protein
MSRAKPTATSTATAAATSAAFFVGEDVLAVDGLYLVHTRVVHSLNAINAILNVSVAVAGEHFMVIL